MPELIELSASTRLGGIVGIFGGQGLVTTWYVATDTVGEDPVEVLSTPGNNGVVIGQPYPWTTFGLVAIGYLPGRRVGPTEWYVDVLYGPPIEFPSNDWTVTSSGSVEVYDALSATRLDANGAVVKNPDGTPSIVPIGPRIFLTDEQYQACTPKPIVDPEFWVATTQDGCKTIRLRRMTQDNARRVKGLSVTRAVSDEYYACTVTQLGKGVRQSAKRSYLNTVNSASFDSYDAGTVKCTEIAISRRTGRVEGQAVTNVVYDIGIRFQVDFNGHQPVYVYDTYIDDNGTEVFVSREETAQQSFTEYYPYPARNFIDLLSMFLPPRNIFGGRG